MSMHSSIPVIMFVIILSGRFICAIGND
jgi:hypothetical protein